MGDLSCNARIFVFTADKEGGQNNGNTKKLGNRFFFVGSLKELQLATLHVLPFVYIL
jgi:hypothetical protein